MYDLTYIGRIIINLESKEGAENVFVTVVTEAFLSELFKISKNKQRRGLSMEFFVGVFVFSFIMSVVVTTVTKIEEAKARKALKNNEIMYQIQYLENELDSLYEYLEDMDEVN